MGQCSSHRVVPCLEDPEDWASYYDELGIPAWSNLRTGELTYTPKPCVWHVDPDGAWYNSRTGSMFGECVDDVPRDRHFSAPLASPVIPVAPASPVEPDIPTAFVV